MWWTADQPISLGPAVVDAYLIADGLDVFGVAVDESALEVAEVAATAELEVPVRTPQGGTAVRRFARLAAFDTFGLVGENYVARFERLGDSYAESPDARPHVCARYSNSVQVVRAMLLS